MGDLIKDLKQACGGISGSEWQRRKRSRGREGSMPGPSAVSREQSRGGAGHGSCGATVRTLDFPPR